MFDIIFTWVVGLGSVIGGLFILITVLAFLFAPEFEDLRAGLLFLLIIGILIFGAGWILTSGAYLVGEWVFGRGIT